MFSSVRWRGLWPGLVQSLQWIYTKSKSENYHYAGQSSLPVGSVLPGPVAQPQSSDPIPIQYSSCRWDRGGCPTDRPRPFNMTAAMGRQDSSATATLTSYKYWPDLDWRLCNYSKNCCLSWRQPQDMSGAERTQRMPGAGLVGRRFSSNNPLTKNLINWNLSVNELPLPLPFSDPHIYRLLATDPGRRQQKKYWNGPAVSSSSWY